MLCIDSFKLHSNDVVLNELPGAWSLVSRRGEPFREKFTPKPNVMLKYEWQEIGLFFLRAKAVPSAGIVVSAGGMYILMKLRLVQCCQQAILGD